MDPNCDLYNASPAELRLLIRQNDFRITITSGLAKGYQQAGVIFLPRYLADDFEAFCRCNPAPLTFLYRSPSGDTSGLPLARDADVRTDISRYRVYEKGQVVKTLSSLKNFTSESRQDQQDERQSCSDMVCFYLGCSFGFDAKLKAAGVPVRNVEQNRNISMYRTAIPCVPAGVFRCPLVVTLRPIPSAVLNTAVEITFLNPLAHGAPVHIGEPALLGIQDLSRPDYGEPVELQPGDVPVFWACGVTAMEAILSSKAPFVISHSPGCMFLTDIPDSSIAITNSPDTLNTINTSLTPELTPRCFLVSRNPLLYSLVSQRAVEMIRRLEFIVGEDPGERGIKALFTEDELLRSCLALSHSESVAITTGFPVHYMHRPPDETDGPPGAIAMATMLLSLGKKVTLVTDRRALEMNNAIIDEAVRTGVLKTTIPLVTFEHSGPDSALQFLCHHGDPSEPRYDHLMAIERSGRAADGNYYTMRGANIKHLVDPIDDLFMAAADIPGITTTGIGGGGNELGMGKLKEKVGNLIPNGKLIACDVPADYTITAGVSNWGGYAVACGLYLLSTCPSHQRYLKRGLGEDTPTSQEQLREWAAQLPSVDKEESFLSILMRFGIQSGISGHLAHPTHSDLITRLLDITMKGSVAENL